MKRSPIWYACQMFLYELRLEWRVANRQTYGKPAHTTAVTVPWEGK